MTTNPITIQFLSRTHEIPAYDSEGLEYRQDCGNGLELRLYRLNRGWMARLDVAAFDTYTQSGRQETAQEAVDAISETLIPLANALFPLTDFIREHNETAAAWDCVNSDPISERPSCDEPTVEMSREMLAEALQGG